MLSPHFLIRSKPRKGSLLFWVKNMPAPNQKNCVFISGQNMWSRYIFGIFSKKVKSHETRLFQGFFEDFERRIFGLVKSVSRTTWG